MRFFKKTIITTALLCFLSISFFVVSAKSAKAQWVVTNPDVTALQIQEKVEKTIGASIMQAGTIALVNSLNYFVQKLAYDAAVWVASGGSGQKPLFDGRSAGDYFAGVASDSFGTFVDDINKYTVGTLGFDLCKPSLSLVVKIQLGLLKPWGPPDKPSCNFQTFVENWDEFTASFTTPEVLKNVGFMFEPGQSELSYAFEVNNVALMKADEKYRQAFLERLNNKGWQSVKDAVTKRVTTPADVVRESFGKSYLDHPYQQQIASWGAFGDALGRGAWQVLPAALQTFANTLVGTATQKLMGGLFPATLLSDDEKKSSVLGGSSGSGGTAVGRREAQQVYSDFIKPKITSASNYDPLIDFTTCPSEDVEKKINNCVIDDQFASAIRIANQTPLTIDQAIKQGYLDGGKPLISSKDSRNEDSNCYQNGYCYSNLVKLRKARILPVGFEIAAEVGAGQAKAPSLSEVVNGFNNCNVNGERDASHPYCHLIDPNWVLKMPKTQCQAQVYGPTLASSQGPTRAQTCADPISCIAEDENGNCIGGWGYCTKERNIWRIDADKCLEQYNTCTTYKPRLAGASQSFIKNTLTFGTCTGLNTGCKAYSLEKNTGLWSDAQGDLAYFNKNVEKCQENDAGCTELYDKTNGLEFNLIKNSSFEELESADSPRYWDANGAISINTDTAHVQDGANSLILPSTGSLTSQLIKLETNTPYVVSAYIKKQNTADANTAVLGVNLFSDQAGTVGFNASNIISTCQVDASGDLALSEQAGDSFNRIECAFLTPNQLLYAEINLSKQGTGPVIFDAIQMEEGASAKGYLSSGYGNVSSLYIKVPPSYLDCDAGSNNPECSNYAPTCRAEEVGCENFAPASGDPAVSAIATISDICPANCAGYETFKQEATNFESQQFPVYFIPQTASTCNSTEVGCDEFTNLDTEATEYFSFLRQCIKPGEAADAVFYTWEGSDAAGYQLRSHRLQTGTVLPGEVAPVPAYINGTDPSLCSQTIFNLPITDPNYNPDCREIYNANGQISYRLLSKTIVSTPDCASYRKTQTNQSDCSNSGGNWDAGAQQCIYKGYSAESISCDASASGCRAYSGAAASNLRIVLQDDFEGASTAGWQGGTISSESLSAGGHSLRAQATAGPKVLTKDIESLLGTNGHYTLSFWAKAPSGGNLSLGFSASAGDLFNITGLKADWQFYEIGPIRTGDVIFSGTSLELQFTDGTGLYVDNIILKEAAGKNYLIKNSWNTPDICDQTINGDPLPQAMLGCEEYTDTQNNTVYLKSFSSLCRESAVGCKSFQNTHNTASQYNEIYNVICARSDLAGGACQYQGQDVCTVGLGNSICRFKITDGQMPSATYSQKSFKDYETFQAQLASDAPQGGYLIARDESTIEISADNPIYLVDNGSKYCSQASLGCSVLGSVEPYKSTASAVPVYYKNLPDSYGNILCTADAEGCESWTSDKGIDYFKIPKSLCEYKEAGVVSIAGWYKIGTTEPCYQGLIRDGAYGIWRNADDKYNGSVGTCPASENGCTEFIDPLDTSGVNQKGRPYYLIDNEKLTDLENHPDCSGKVSQEEGCVLFNKTSDINLKWNADASYAKATKEKKLVAPFAATGACCTEGSVCAYSAGNIPYCATDSDCASGEICNSLEGLQGDSNVILRVTRDRECGQWIACKTTIKAVDPLTNTARPICTELGLCNKYQASEGNATCANFLASNPDSGEVLDAEYYSSREVGWEKMDYSGFSIGGQFPITDVEFENIGDKDNKDIKMYGAITRTPGGTIGGVTSPGSATYFDLKGNSINSANFGESKICRAYPESDSPFPTSIGQYDINGRLQAIDKRGFQNANICEYEENCDCEYTKLTYGNATTKKYVEYGNRSVPDGICQGGSRDGEPCKPGVSYEQDPKNSCGSPTEGGTCLKLKRQDDVIGWEGYCLEYDLSTPINGDNKQKACLTWLPQDLVPGARDIYNQFKTAGYVPPLGAGKYYCLEASGNWTNFDNHYDHLLRTGPDPSGLDCSGVASRICGLGSSVNQNLSLGNLKIDSYSEFYGSSDGWGGTQGLQGIIDKNDTTKTKKIYKNEVDLIKIEIIDQFGGNNFPEGAVFYIRPDQAKTNYLGFGELCDDKKTNNCSGESEGSVGLSGSQKARSIIEGNSWYFRYDDGQGDDGRDYLNTNLFIVDDKQDINSYCNTGATSPIHHSFALRFFFNKDTGLLETLSVIGCASDTNNTEVSLAVSVRKREICTTVIDVAASKNQAFTNNLWQYNPINKNKQKLDIVTEGITKTLPYHYDYEMQPFGSAASDISPADKEAWHSYYTIGTPTFGGVPWACGNKGEPTYYCGTPKESDNDDTTIDFDSTSSYQELTDAFTGGLLDARRYIGKLFSKIYNVFQFKTGTQVYEEKNCDDVSAANYCDLATAGDIVPYMDMLKVPKVFSFDSIDQLPNGQYTLKNENRFLINNQSTDINIEGSQYVAIMRFYFWADTDHMPIKSIKVDWGDGSVTETTEGLYKNHKPICAETNAEGAKVCNESNDNIVCNSSEDCPKIIKINEFIPGSEFETAEISYASVSQSCDEEEVLTFGNSPDACEENFYEIQHIYTCSSDTCTYSPKLYVTDNWGVDNSLSGKMIEKAELDSKVTGLDGLFGPATGPTITLTP